MSAAHSSVAPPPGTYWVEPGRLLAGAYPGHVEPSYAAERIASLLRLGINHFIDLTWPGELPDYDELLPTPAGGEAGVAYSRYPIEDHGLPRNAAQMQDILHELGKALDGGRRVYVHCRAGIGRTGTVIGCFLAERLGDGGEALEAIERLWVRGGRHRDWPRTPETDQQVEFVRGWRTASTDSHQLADRLQDRYRGLLLGLALGDALAAPVQHRRPGSFTPIGDLLGGGPYDLPRGAWSDDAAVALLLAESLSAAGSFDARDLVERLFLWQREGVGSATGQCVGITASTAKAVAQAKWSGNPFAGSHDPARADKEPLPRAAIAAAFGLSDPARAIDLAADVARPTHQAPQVLDACRYVAALCVGALQGASKERLLEPDFTPVPGIWTARPLRREVALVASGSWAKPGFTPVADGTAADSLALALWALARGSQYRDTVLAAVNLGLDADANGALVGALAGALYGAASLPPHWVAGLAQTGQVRANADRLLAGALARIAAE